MNKKFDVLGIIPARGGSKGIPKKNIKLLNKKPLIYYTINESQKSNFITRLVVSTDDNNISKISKKLGVEVINRPKKFAGDKSNAVITYKHIIRYLEKNENYIPDIVVILQPTSPLRSVEDIDKSIKTFISKNCDVVVSVTNTSHPPHWTLVMNKNNRLNFYFKNTNPSKPRQDYPQFYTPNGAVIVTTFNHMINCKDVLSNDVVAYIMPEERSIDIDTLFDFKLAEMLIKNKSKP
jgi:CMP-N,N'-diacetyllegionaminic acid synthase